ncbi:Rrf2 family transcriptional regulator [Gammaproteobacteria bacterium]|nr:Rrf2 family transcriptional regulator [Gammaproteobacteria bacterium]
MRVTTKGRYAVSAMIELALREKEGNTALAEIAEIQGISLSYLEQLFAALRRNALVEGTRGPGGGYRLARPSQEISIAEIITAVDEKVEFTNCLGEQNCDHGERCLTHDLWSALSSRMHEFLDSIVLGDLVSWPNVKRAAERQHAVHANNRSGGVRVDLPI